MANSAQAIKRARQNKKSALRNRSQHSGLRTAIKKFLKAVLTKDEQAAATFPKVASLIDKTATKGIIHRNKAARLKSRLSSKLKAIQA